MNALFGHSQRRSTLPVPLTPIIGRENDARLLYASLYDHNHRVVTLTGTGGIGKTRLAIHVAQSVAEHFDETLFVPLAAVREPHLALRAIAQALDYSPEKDMSIDEQIIGSLQGRDVLLVLDNVEQVLSVAPALVGIVADCPGATLLITSQAALHVASEQIYPLSPLTTPAADASSTEDILRSDAVDLFIQRARSVNPGFDVNERNASVLAAICRSLDGLPLAIELAAARIGMLSPEALLARLSNRLKVLGGDRRDVPDRLRTMRNAIAWSYGLLEPPEQGMFRTLSVFTGGFPLEAVEAIPTPEGVERDPLDLLSVLVDHGLIRTLSLDDDEPRYLMLQTLRDFGLEQLQQNGEMDVVRLAHAAYFARMSEEASPHLIDRDQVVWGRRLETEKDNLRSACEFALEHGHADIAARIAVSIWRFCSTHGMSPDCRAWLMRVLDSRETIDPAWKVSALNGCGNLSEDLREFESAKQFFGHARDLARDIGAIAAQAEALIGLGGVAHTSGDYEEAYDFLTEAETLARESGDRHCIARAVGNLGTVCYYRGQFPDAVRHWEEARSIVSILGDSITEANITGNLGALAYDSGDLERAETLQRRALQLQRELGSMRDLPNSLINLGEVSSLLGDFVHAHDCFAEALEILSRYANPAVEASAYTGLARLANAQGEQQKAATALLRGTNLADQAGHQRGVIENLEVLAGMLSAEGNHRQAVELVAAAWANRAILGADSTPFAERHLQSIQDAARRQLSTDDYDASWKAGACLGPESLVKSIRIAARRMIGPKYTINLQEDESTFDDEQGQLAERLTKRETEVLRMLTQGRSTNEIAEGLYISQRTATTHIANILGKLQVPSRAAAVALAMRERLV